MIFSLKMAYSQSDFTDFSNYEIVEFINEINRGLNENLPIANTHHLRGGAYLRNIKTLMDYFNQHNAYQIIGSDFNDEGFDKFIIHMQNQREYEQNHLNILHDELNYENELNKQYEQYYEHEQQQQEDNRFFNNFDKSDY